MTESPLFNGAGCAAPEMATASEMARPAYLRDIECTTSHLYPLSPSLLPVLDHQPRLPVELLIDIVEWLSIPPARTSFRLEEGSLRALASLGLVSRTLNGMITPVLYRRIRLATFSAIQSFHSTLSNPPRGAYLSSFVKYFFAYDETDQSTACIQDLVTLLRDSVEYIHIDKWPDYSSKSDLRDRLASVRNLRQLSIGKRRGSSSPAIHVQNQSTLESVVLDDSNVAQIGLGILPDVSEGGSDGVVGRNLTIYCVGHGFLPCFFLKLMLEAYFHKLLAAKKEPPPFRIVMFLIESTTLPPELLHFSRKELRDHWYYLPVSASFENLGTVEFRQWLRGSIEDGSIWEITPIPADEWAVWARENVGQPRAEETPGGIIESQTQSNLGGPSTADSI